MLMVHETACVSGAAPARHEVRPPPVALSRRLLSRRGKEGLFRDYCPFLAALASQGVLIPGGAGSLRGPSPQKGMGAGGVCSRRPRGTGGISDNIPGRVNTHSL